ncbi:hypothetical protein [Streptomyces sp. NBC_00344]|uniref:hypothetical protein n=1 Tax=Streptomyces sp. NBC_00344 TaxID=2975720 RepID=UPI002E1AB8AD
MTKTIPGSVGPAHQLFRRPRVGRTFGEHPGPAVSYQQSQRRQHPPVITARPIRQGGPAPDIRPTLADLGRFRFTA